MKFRPTYRRGKLQILQKVVVLTYGATPATVGIMPLYRAKNPPSFLYIDAISAHMPGSFSPAFLLIPENEALCIDNRVLTISRGYVHVTEVMPAQPPQNSRW